MVAEPDETAVNWDHYYRVVSTRFPPINVFETVLNHTEFEAAFVIESHTAFTHIGAPSRFSDGTFGVLYAGESTRTAVLETKFHCERFLAATHEPPCTQEKRLYVGEVLKPMLDFRGRAYRHLLDPDVGAYAIPQAFGRARRESGAWGLLYPSVRHADGECVAVFRPPAVSRPRQSKHYQYLWDGDRIADVLEVTSVLGAP